VNVAAVLAPAVAHDGRENRRYIHFISVEQSMPQKKAGCFSKITFLHCDTRLEKNLSGDEKAS